MAVEISKYYQSFSGTDTLVFILLPGCTPVCIGSLSTVSYSMYRNKKPVINIGRTNINGITRGSRIYAGTMIFTLINQHWLRELQEMPQAAYLKKYKQLKVDDMPLFDLMVISANEYGNAVKMFIWGIDVTDEAQTISVEDMFTENVFSFVARDVSVFTKIPINVTQVSENREESEIDDTEDESSVHTYVFDSDVFEQKGEINNELIKITRPVYRDKQLSNIKVYDFIRTLYYKKIDRFVGTDVQNLQIALNNTEAIRVKVTGIFDEQTDKAIRDYQSFEGLTVNGIVDKRLYVYIIEHNQHSSSIPERKRTIIVTNRNGAFVYRKPSLTSNIVNTIPYKEMDYYKDIVTNTEDNTRFYQVQSGYVSVKDAYSSYNQAPITEYPTLRLKSTGYPVTILQNLIVELYSPDAFEVTGIYNEQTAYYVQRLQEEHNLQPTGIVDYNTWLTLQSISPDLPNDIAYGTLYISYNKVPASYDCNATTDLIEFLSTFTTTMYCSETINVKASVICYYNNNKTRTNTKTVAVHDETEFNILDFQNDFLYNDSTGNLPNKVEYTLYPFNKTPYKWIINLK